MRRPSFLSIAIAVTGMFLADQLPAFAQARPRSVADVIGKLEKTTKIGNLIKLTGAGKLDSLALICIKEHRLVELWANGRFIKRYPLTAYSGELGPKRKRGDLQIPEGVYRAGLLNPNSSFHLSIKVEYPNKWDLDWAKTEGRDDLGGDIYIHGAAASVGCLALGDENIEEVFYMVHRAGLAKTRIIISPFDFRKKPYRIEADPKVLELYDTLKRELVAYSE